MQILARVKTLGRDKGSLTPVPRSIPDSTRSLRQLLTAVVEGEVSAYNRKIIDPESPAALTAQEIENQASAGKVSFGWLYSDKLADPSQAVNNAIQCWQDGLVRVFLGDDELTGLDDPLEIHENDTFTFLRLTFLAGRLW